MLDLVAAARRRMEADDPDGTLGGRQAAGLERIRRRVGVPGVADRETEQRESTDNARRDGYDQAVATLCDVADPDRRAP